MNNSQIQDSLQEEPTADIAPMLRSRQEEIAKIIEAIDSISQSNHWKLLEKNLFQGVLDSLINQLIVEKEDRKIPYLQGKIDILIKYSDFKKFSETYRLELKNIEQKLKAYGK